MDPAEFQRRIAEAQALKDAAAAATAAAATTTVTTASTTSTGTHQHQQGRWQQQGQPAVAVTAAAAAPASPPAAYPYTAAAAPAATATATPASAVAASSTGYAATSQPAPAAGGVSPSAASAPGATGIMAPQAAPPGLDPAQQLAWQQYQVQYQQWQQQQQQWNQYQEYQRRQQQQQQQQPQQYTAHQQQSLQQQPQTVYLGIQPQQQQQAPLLGGTHTVPTVTMGGIVAAAQTQPGQRAMDVDGGAKVGHGGAAQTTLSATPVYATPHPMAHPAQVVQQQGAYMQQAAPVAYQSQGYAPPTGYAAYPQQHGYPQQQPQQVAAPIQQQLAPPVVMLPAAIPQGYPVPAAATHAAPPGVVIAPQLQQQPGYGAPPPQQMWGQQPVPQQAPIQQQQQQQQQPQGFVQPPPGVVPTLPPMESKDAERVDKMAEYVARNGVGFEDIVKEREKDNKMLSFLFFGELHEYYKWSLHCARMGFTPEQRHAQIALYQHHKLMEKQAKDQAIQRMVAAGEMVPGANLSLDAQNAQQFELLLKQLVGSQDSIHASKDWVVSRLGHYGVNIAWRMRVFAKETEVAAGGEGPKALPRSKACDKVIHVLYLTNDVLFSIQHHPAADIFKAECLRQVPGILRSACTLDPELTGGSLDKIERIVRLWGSNGVFTATECDGLLAAAATVTAKHASAKAMARKAAHGLRERASRGGWDREGSGSGTLGGAAISNGDVDSGMGSGTLAQATGDPEADERRKRQEERMEKRNAEEKSAEEAFERALARVKALADGPAPTSGAESTKGGVGLPLAVAVQAVPTLAPAPETMPACHVQFPWRGALYPVMGKAQSTQSDVNKFPVAAGLASTAHGTDNMLEKLPVGTMAGILRVALRNGFRRYKPVDMKLLPKYVTPHIEPGRLDVRVDEFYSRSTLKLVEEERKKEKERRVKEEERRLTGKDGAGGPNDREGGRRNRDGGFAAGGSQQGLRAKQAQLELESDMQGREKVLGEENIGHNLLKKMGWSEGTGLGSSRSGMVEPISGSGQMDKAGIGGGDGAAKKKTAAEQDAFEAYRRNKSYSFRRF